MPDNGDKFNPDRIPDKKGRSDFARYAAFTSTPYMLIVYPLVGFGLGYLTVYYWHWSIFVPVVTMVLGLVQGIREVLKIGEKLDRK